MFIRLDVDVGSPFADCFNDDLVDQFDDAGLLRHLKEILTPLDHDSRSLITGAHHLIQRVTPQSIMGFDDLLDFIALRQHRLDFQTGAQPEIVERI